MKRVVFSKENIQDALKFVHTRQAESINLQDAHGLVQGSPKLEEDRQLRGVLGEWAVANLLGMHYIHTVNTFKAPDLFLPDGRPIQVRGTMQRHGDLVIRPNAKDSEIYVLTYWAKTEGVVYVRGWITAYEARRLAEQTPGLVQDRSNRQAPAIFIPEKMLHGMEELHHESAT